MTARSADSDEMPQKVASHLSLHSLQICHKWVNVIISKNKYYEQH